MEASMMSVMAINGGMYENRHKFLIFLRSMLEIDISQEETSDFYMNGFLPVEWLDALFERTLTFDQYRYINDMMELMYPSYMSLRKVTDRHSLYSMRQRRALKLDDYEDDLLHKDRPEENISEVVNEPKKVQKTVSGTPPKRPQQKSYSWSKKIIRNTPEPTLQKKRYSRLSEIVAEIFDLACKKSLHPSGSCVDLKTLQENIAHILPGHHIEVDNAAKLITLVDESHESIATYRIPKDFPCIRL
jgi:hypothetical protein